MWCIPSWRKTTYLAKLFYSKSDKGAGNGPNIPVELYRQDFPKAEAAAGPGIFLGSLDRADYLPPPPAASTPPTDVAQMSIGFVENAGWVMNKSVKKMVYIIQVIEETESN